MGVKRASIFIAAKREYPQPYCQKRKLLEITSLVAYEVAGQYLFEKTSTVWAMNLPLLKDDRRKEKTQMSYIVNISQGN